MTLLLLLLKFWLEYPFALVVVVVVATVEDDDNGDGVFCVLEIKFNFFLSNCIPLLARFKLECFGADFLKNKNLKADVVLDPEADDDEPDEVTVSKLSLLLLLFIVANKSLS